MTTGENYTNITNKRVMGLEDWRDRFFDYMQNQAQETNRLSYSDQTFIKYGATLSADGTDRFQIAKDNASTLACDGLGHFLDPDPTLSEMEELYFENTNTIDYHVHLGYAAIPADVQINPVYGKPEYTYFQDQIGVSGTPNSVVDNGGTITFNVTNITESGSSQAGRKCLVYKTVLAEGAVTSAIAIEECIVQWSGGVNQITTTGTLGQTTVSTTAADYEVVLLGPKVNRFTGAVVANFAYVGFVTGVGAGSAPTVFDHTGQTVIQNSWVDILLNGFSNDLLPATDDTYDIGSSSQQWKDGWFDGTLNTDRLTLSTSAGEGVSSSIVPTSDDTYNLGSPTYEWRDGYFDGTLNVDTLTISASAGEGIGSHLRPISDNIYDIGSATYQWNDGHFGGTLNSTTLIASNAAGEGVGSDLIPTTDDTYDIGSSSYKWKDGYFDGTVSIDTLALNQTNGLGVLGDVKPVNIDTHDIGTSTYYWQNLYSNNIYYKTTFTTFDEFDDLDMVEAYTPTNETTLVKRDGKDIEVKKGDSNTIPWPMLGPKVSDTDEHFLDMGNSTTFLLGAIKQLYQKYKKTTSKMQKEIDSLNEKMLNFSKVGN